MAVNMKSPHGKFLGEKVIDNLYDTPFRNNDKKTWAMYYIEAYGQYDGDHHKAWVLDQVARILKGTKVVVKVATWEDGFFEYRITLGNPSKKYLRWVKEMKDGEDGEETYSYEVGTPP